jgi:hypothetical protein
MFLDLLLFLRCSFDVTQQQQPLQRGGNHDFNTLQMRQWG